nr:MAG TPA: hypothetical protein [Caudoviricetes sp.]
MSNSCGALARIGHPSLHGFEQGGSLIPFSQQSVLKMYVTDTLIFLPCFGQKSVTKYFCSIEILLPLILGYGNTL